MKHKFVFIHIPKSAGTTFHRILSPNYKMRVIKGSWEVYENSRYFEKVTSEPGYDRDEMFKRYEVIRGSFPYQRFYYLKKKYKWKLITWVRDPVERLISNYNHLVHRPSPSLYKKGAKQKLVFEKARSMNIVEFSKYLSDFNTRHIGEDPSIFDFIGVVERFPKSLDLFNKKFNSRLQNRKRSNVHRWKKRVEVSQEVKEELKSHHPKDYKFYNNVIKRYE